MFWMPETARKPDRDLWIRDFPSVVAGVNSPFEPVGRKRRSCGAEVGGEEEHSFDVDANHKSLVDGAVCAFGDVELSTARTASLAGFEAGRHADSVPSSVRR